MKKHVIWESQPELNETTISYVRADMKEMEVDNADMMSDDEVERYFIDVINADQLDCERYTLDQQLPGKVIAIADLGRWNGRCQGYRIMGENLNEVLRSHVNGLSDLCVFGDGYNIRANESHHDGINHYLYRMLRPNVNEEPLLEAIYSGKPVSSSMLNHYTRSLYPYAARIYGWPCRQHKKSGKSSEQKKVG